jgi:diacylglycerol kinase family enzyme
MTQGAGVVSVIVNEASGSQAKDLREVVERAFSLQGLGTQWLPISRQALAMSREHAVERLIMRAEGPVAVAGGDGTVNAVASVCRKLRRPLGILPAGTFNYVARNLGLPTDMDAAAEVIAHGQPAPIHVGEINGRLFLNNAGFGLYSDVIERREQDKRRFGRRRIVAFVSGLRCLAESHPVHHIHITTDGREHELRTTTLFFGVNALQLANYNVEAAKFVERGELAVLSLRLESRLDIAAAAAAALLGKLEAARSVDATHASSVRVTARRRSLKVAIDGEIVMLQTPLRVRMVAGGLQVMLPVASAAEQETPAIAAGEQSGEHLRIATS